MLSVVQPNVHASKEDYNVHTTNSSQGYKLLPVPLGIVDMLQT